MKRLAIPVVCIIALWLILFGCAPSHHVKPPLKQLEAKDLISDIRTKHSVAVMPAKSSTTEPIQICKDDFSDYFALRDELTDSAINNLKAIFKQKKIIVNATAEKKLKIAVLHARCSGTPPWDFGYHVTLRVQAGDTIVLDFTGFNRAGIGNIASNISVAINEAYLMMFKNNEIKHYLEN